MNKKHHIVSDKELWKLLRNGDREALSLLYVRHITNLLNYGRYVVDDTDLIKDTLQEVFIEFWEKRNSLSEVSQIKPYLLKTLRNKLLRSKAKLSKHHFLVWKK